jgi:heptosyltransferase-3
MESASSAQPLDLATLAHILVVKPDEIGDFILCSPFLRGLRSSAPHASIGLVTSATVADLARACPHVDYVMGPDDAATFHAAVEKHGFDLAVVPRFDVDRYGGGFIAQRSRAKRIVGFSERCTPLKAHFNRGFDSRYYTDVLLRDPAAHEVEHSLALLDHIGGRRAGQAVELHLRADDRRTADRVVAETADRLHGSRLLAVAPGSSYPCKELPGATLARIAGQAAAAIDAGIVVLGTSAQAAQGADLESLLAGRAINLCGSLPLPAAAALIARSAAVISMCSAAGHIAAAFDRPSVVFSCHPRSGDPAHFHSPLRFRPWARPDRALVIQPAEPLPPCTQTCEAETSHCIGNFDLTRTIETVTQFFIAATANRSPAADPPPGWRGNSN